MVKTARDHNGHALGHIAVFATNERRRLALARALEAEGHSCHAAGASGQLRRLLDHQRFDVGTWVVRDDGEAAALASALDGAKLPLHTLVVGSATAVPHIKRRRGGTLRLLPSNLTAGEVAKVAGGSISRGTWDEGLADEQEPHREPVEIESIIEGAASAVYKQAKRKQQRFSTVVSANGGHVFGSRGRLRKIFIALLRVVVDLAPVGASITTTASEGAEEWQVSVAASIGGARRPIATTAGELDDEEEALRAVSQDVREQGGILWVDLAGPEALSVCFTLPLPVEARPPAEELQHA